MPRGKNPKYIAGALAATFIAAISYKVYSVLTKDGETDSGNTDLKGGQANSKKSIAVTLLHSVLRSDFPLNDVLLTFENVTFILPPCLSVDDLLGQIQGFDGDEKRTYMLPQTLIKNYKLLKCSNMMGYFHLLKNLKPDLLYVCSDDLGITKLVPQDMHRFVKEVVTLDQDKTSVQSVLSKVLIK